MNTDMDDLLADLGVVLPPGKGAPAARRSVGEGSVGEGIGNSPKRHTEWNNFARFKPNGYVARVWHDTCECCGERADVLEGVFGEELGNGGRRLTQVGRGVDWPVGAKLRLERTDRGVEYCVACLEDLGFEEGEGEGSRTIVIRAE